MKFSKFQGIGNDFIISEDELDYDITKLCDRHYGVGADGVIILTQEKDNVFIMKIYNADGSEATTCGNGLRCVNAYLKDKYKKDEFIIKTIKDSYRVRYFNDDIYEVDFPNVSKIKKDGDIYIVEVSNLHVFTTKKTSLEEFTHIVRNKYDSNVEVVKIINKGMIKLRVNERGVGETFACGSACIAIVSALYKDKLVNNEVVCLMKGGSLKVRISENKITLLGEAKFIYKGEIYA